MNETTFKKLTDAAGDEFFCPLDLAHKLEHKTDRDFSECVGKDVVGRYAGNLDIQS